MSLYISALQIGQLVGR